MSFDNLPPGVTPSDLEPDEKKCRHCEKAPCKCQIYDNQIDQMRLER